MNLEEHQSPSNRTSLVMLRSGFKSKSKTIYSFDPKHQDFFEDLAPNILPSVRLKPGSMVLSSNLETRRQQLTSMLQIAFTTVAQYDSEHSKWKFPVIK